MTAVGWQPEVTWRKLGFLFFTDSLAYRAVIEENPQWDVVTQPPLGAQLQVSSPIASTGGLSQSTFIFGIPSGNTQDAIFPFSTVQEYETAVDRYTLYSVLYKDSINGYTLDSFAAETGIQT
jgi:hypothetical protein